MKTLIFNLLHVIFDSCEPEAKFRLKMKGKVVNVNIPTMGMYYVKLHNAFMLLDKACLSYLVFRVMYYLTSQ